MSFYVYYPSSSGAANPSVGANGAPAPAFSTEIGGVDGAGDLIPVSVDSSGNVNANVVSAVLPPNAATASNQVTQIGHEASIDTSVAAIDTKTPALGQAAMAASVPVVIASDQSAVSVTGPLTNTQLRAADVNVLVTNGSVPVRGNGVNGTSVTANDLLIAGDDGGTQRNIQVDSAGKLNVNVSSSVIPTGAATAANQTTEIAAINSFAAKTAAGFVPNAFDETVITYVGVTTDISTVVYKLAGSTVATLTMSYDGSGRLSDVVKT